MKSCIRAIEIIDDTDDDKTDDEEISDAECKMTSKKRRKLELTWDIIKEKLFMQKELFHIYSWLRIVDKLIEIDLKRIPKQQVNVLTTYLNKLLNEQKETFILNASLKCFNKLLENELEYRTNDQNDVTVDNNFNADLIQNLYYSCLNTLKYDLCKYEAYSCIERIIKLSNIQTTVTIIRNCVIIY